MGCALSMKRLQLLDITVECDLRCLITEHQQAKESFVKNKVL